MSVITCGYCTNDTCKHCVLMNCAPEHLPELVQMQEERDEARRRCRKIQHDLESANRTITELREALDAAIKEDMRQKDEVALGYLQQLHDAKTIIRLLVNVL